MKEKRFRINWANDQVSSMHNQHQKFPHHNYQLSWPQQIDFQRPSQALSQSVTAILCLPSRSLLGCQCSFLFSATTNPGISHQLLCSLFIFPLEGFPLLMEAGQAWPGYFSLLLVFKILSGSRVSTFPNCVLYPCSSNSFKFKEHTAFCVEIKDVDPYHYMAQI